MNRGKAIRVLLFLIPIAAAMTVRALRAFSTHQVLDWDETYYMSQAVTAAAGGGLYPFIYGFAPMHVMGGTGYAAYAYAWAVRAFGPTIFALRGVSIVISVIGLGGIWAAVRTWYGSAAAWIAIAITASLRLFALSNTARMDAFAFAWVAWGIAAVALAFERWSDRRLHVAAGLLFGLGPEIHLDTLATAAACGVLYLVRYVRDSRASRRWMIGHPMFLFAGAFAAGLIVYVAANVLPDVSSYYTMTVRVRVSATSMYSSGTGSVFASFLDPRILAAKEAILYRELWSLTPAFEALLFAGGALALIVRRNASDRLVLTLAIVVLIAAAALLNNASPLYYIHVLPALVIPIAPLFTHGLRGRSKIALADLPAAPLVAAAAVVFALTVSTSAATLRSVRATPPPSPEPANVRHVKTIVDRGCVMASDAGMYVPYFAAYPWFISFRPTEVALAMLYYRTTDEAAYWRLKAPDAVFSREPLSPALARYVAGRPLRLESPGLWIDPAGCRKPVKVGHAE